MMWVRNPWWDGFWLLSGLPIGLAITGLVWVGVPWFWIAATCVLVFQTAHTLAPMGLAWSHSGFRTIMLRQPIKFVVIPLTILLTWTVAGWIAGLFWRPAAFDPLAFKLSVDSRLNPIWIMGAVYGIWNIYHFGKQNFGIMSIYRRKVDARISRRPDLIFCCVMTWAAMTVPTIHLAANYLRWEVLHFYPVLAVYITVAVIGVAVMLWRERKRRCLPRVILILTNGIGMASAMVWGLGGLAIISVNHWLTAIGLAGHARGRSVWFPMIVIVLGMLLFGALFIRGWQIPTEVAGAAVGFRLALGIVHFLYDRWVWKLSDPLVRATIGQDLFPRSGIPKDKSQDKLELA
jgi:hypothetical protein